MAPEPSGSVALLRATTFRLSSTPAKLLPSVTPQITGAVWNCRDLLSTPTDAKQNSETSVVIHRFKTQLSTLLQERTIEGRWAAVVLVKSTIEAGGIEVLAKCNAWVKSLLGILKKPDPPTTRGLAVLALTRIFMLTWDYSNLVREITTPALTAFVPTCLSNIENKRCSTTELETVLEAFSILLPHHPTIFRSNESRLRIYLSNVLSSRSTNLDSASHYSTACRDVASRLLVQLHSCAPKQGASDKWADTMKAVTTAAHATCDRIFRAVEEDWKTTSGVVTSAPSHMHSGEVESESEDAAGLKPWRGIYSGGERLVSLLDLMKSHLATATSGTVPVRMGVTADLLTRLFAVTLPHSSNRDFIKINAQVSKDEREAMYAVLPSIHVAALDLCSVITRRFGSELTGWTQLVIERMSQMFKAERRITELRAAAYRFLSNALVVNGPSMSRSDVADLSLVLEVAIVDLSATASASTQNSNGIKQQLGMAGSNSAQSHPTETTEVSEAAIDLLRTVLGQLDAVCIPAKTRTQIDRIAVISRNERLLFASVLNPHRKHNDARVPPSLLPILAREFGDRPQVEALLRPRMPPIGVKQGGNVEGNDDDEEDDEEEDPEDETIHDEDAFDTAVESPEDHTTAQVGVEQQARPAPDKTDTVLAIKRPATGDASSSSSAKRLRASPAGESLLPDDDDSTLPGPDSATVEEDIPSTVVLPGAGGETVTAFRSNANITAAGADDEGSDDSDDGMVVPLTMEDSDADDGE